jgi:hypothetical protein
LDWVWQADLHFSGVSLTSSGPVRTPMHSLMANLGIHSTLEVVALARPRLEALPEIARSTHGVLSGGVHECGCGADHPNLA